MFLLDDLKAQLARLTTPQDYCIAYSGGLDSHVLLHMMVELRRQIPNIKLQAIHINHGLSANAAAWAAHCQDICVHLDVAFHSEVISTSPNLGESVEAWAREVRYAVFKKKLAPHATLVTAHTEDDQTETVLLQLLRGAGPKGLAAMSQHQSFAHGYLWRPLLHLTRQQLSAYALQQQLTWLEDESNMDCRFDRNFLRHEIIPRLRQRWPAVGKNISRSARHCAEAGVILADLGQLDIYHSAMPANQLAIADLQLLSPSRQRNALRYWLTANGCRLPNTKCLLELQHNLLCGRADANPQVSWGRWVIRRYRQNLMILTASLAPPIVDKIFWNLCSPLDLPNHLGQLRARQSMGEGISLAANVEQLELSIRFRQGGERCQPKGKTQSTSLKKLFQQWAVPPWQRDQIPLLYLGDKLISVVGYCVSQEFAAEKNELGWIINQDLLPGLQLTAKS